MQDLEALQLFRFPATLLFPSDLLVMKRALSWLTQAKGAGEE